ncbi:MAG: cystathionine beta-lyase [Alphaproteobacteria bacterium]|nr:cystathionine beta-lyase [Alphaproteobacteria bacterium]
MKDETRLVHTGRSSEQHIGAVNTPVYRASTILHPTLAALEGNTLPYGYGRRGTPTTRGLEESICALEGGARTVLTPSGLSAVTAAILSVVGAGDHLLMVDSCYDPTRTFCDGTLKRFGVETTYYHPTITPDELGALIRPNTKALFLESPGSITFEVQDVPALTAVAKARGLSVLADNTWATPLWFKPLAHGVDLSILSATKYVVGHADALLGTITANESHVARLMAFHGQFGMNVSGDDAYLAHRGLRTMAVRLARHQETGLKLARWFKGQDEVARVLHPALPECPGHAIWQRDIGKACGLFGVELKPIPKRAVAAMLDGLELFGMGWSWGGFESLAVTEKWKRVAPGSHKPQGPLLRFHAGLEDSGDLIADLEAGIARLRNAA